MTKEPESPKSPATEPSEVLRHWNGPELARLVEGLPVGLYVCDPEGLVTYCNPRAVEILGRCPELGSAEDRFCGSFRLSDRNGDSIDPEDSWMARALRNGGQPESREVVIEDAAGELRMVLARARAVRDEDGRLLGAVNVLVDITERTRNEEAVRASDRAKDQFLIRLTHELRNPLAPVRHAMQILERQGTETPEGSWALGVIGRQVGQLSRLIDDLVDLSRIPDDQLVLYRQPVELGDVVRFALDTSRPALEERSQTVTVEQPNETIWLDADPVRLSQALANLLERAGETTKARGRIDLTVRKAEGGVALSVQDYGRGIDPEKLEQVFDPYAQLDDTGSGARSGLGISLALVKEIVEKHGGGVEVESGGEGMGSRFTIRLPLADELGDPAPAAEPVEDDGSALRILVVDDNRDSAFGLARLLEMEGHECHTGFDGLRAVELANELRPDVVVLDIGLPGIDGFEAARRIRALLGEGVLLVAVTGWGLERDRIRSREAGFDHHLVKPVGAEALFDLLPGGPRVG